MHFCPDPLSYCILRVKLGEDSDSLTTTPPQWSSSTRRTSPPLGSETPAEVTNPESGTAGTIAVQRGFQCRDGCQHASARRRRTAGQKQRLAEQRKVPNNRVWKSRNAALPKLATHERIDRYFDRVRFRPRRLGFGSHRVSKFGSTEYRGKNQTTRERSTRQPTRMARERCSLP